MQDILASGSLLIAAAIAVLAGLISFFSPCVLPLLPGYLAVLGGSVTASRARNLAGAALFVAGFTVVFVAFFMFAGTVGAWLISYQDLIIRLLGAVIIFAALIFMGFFARLQRSVKLPAPRVDNRIAALVLGAGFAIGWTPCIGPTLSVIFTLSLQEATAARGAFLGICYCLGLGLPFLLAASGVGWIKKASAWVRGKIRLINIVSGCFLLVLGILMVSGLWIKLLTLVQSWMATVVLPL